MHLKGLLPGKTVTIMYVVHHGSIGAEVAYKDANGQIGNEIIYADTAQTLEAVSDQLPWSFDADGSLFRLVSEAYRIHLAYLFDPLIAVHTSMIDPLPHQITAVYETMLNKQPLRYLLADDPGAGKTIMTGLFIKELMMRGDLRRCLIVAPGNLVEQWQDEMKSRFHLSFEIVTNDRLEASATGNAFEEIPLCIARLDKLARNEHVQALLAQTEWDLIVADEAHKMSATFFSSEEIKYTKRYRLGEQIGQISRHLLLLSATPHNGKEEDFQLFMRLLDSDRFEGRFRDGVHRVDVSDLMRHLVKEQLYTFAGTPLFPERLAYTLNYTLSEPERALYQRVTSYVRDEFNRAEALENNGRKGTVGFALTILQRRLASSPEAIYQSLRRRRERMERRRLELRNVQADASVQIELFQDVPLIEYEDFDELDDAPASEQEATEEQILDQATSARTIAELEAEIRLLFDLEALALQVRNSGQDRKWEELAILLQDREEMFTAAGQRHKLVIFTEHRDTLEYLANRIRTMLGQPEAVVTIHGGMNREERAKAQQAFTNDPTVLVLVATDAAGEGINLQCAHLMVNYDLPWNPNRLEQRFGRIHRIGQTEVCHLWNLVAAQTREGEVFQTLFRKLEIEREALGGQVFDVLGKVTFANRPLRDLIVEAIRYGEQPEVRDRLSQVVEEAMDRQHLEELLAERALTHEVLDVARVHQVREFMERAQARRLQPHFIAAFFLAAFKKLGGQAYRRDGQRYELTHVPAALRQRALRLNPRAPLAARYERITFEKDAGALPGKPRAEFVCPGHPLLDAVLDMVLEQGRELLMQGTILVDGNDLGTEPRLLCYLEHTIQDARLLSTGQAREVSRQLHFVEINGQGQVTPAGYAPFLDYRPLCEEERTLADATHTLWSGRQPEQQARTYAIEHLVPQHVAEVKERREEQIRKTMAAVNERLSKEITYWDGRAATLRAHEAAGKANARINSQKAQERSDELAARLKHRLEELEQERKLSPLPPVVVGGALIVPQGLLDLLQQGHSTPTSDPALFAHETALVERLAMEAVMRTERQLGHEPSDVSALKCGYDIESRDGQTGVLRFIEVKGRHMDATTVTITKNEILTAFNQPAAFILALVRIDPIERLALALRYVRQPFNREPDFGATSVNYDLQQLWHKGEAPLYELS
ncbi:RNA helicase [Dictyobacter sp. S3.2.2.5]|uniref:RNA helicase n=2 Tax=Dictyobacter halimunensis TaxID=3026934 RepID=A0ABQ6FPX7_9CHLR|nr:RNA helicase [Dictyobacter sp. S3.2.2.5]